MNPEMQPQKRVLSQALETDKAEKIRSEAEANEIINKAIREVADAFEGEMTARDREMLLAVASEKSTDPFGRVTYLLQIRTAAGVSEKLTGYINQALQTLRSEFNDSEKARFRPFGKSILDDIQ
jgi:ribosomal protein L22